MPRFSANLSLLFTELPLLERFIPAGGCGFKAAEIQFPYETPAEHIKEKIDMTGLELVLINVPAGDFITGGEGLAAVPSRRQEFNDAVSKAFEYADVLRPKFINILPGCCFDTEHINQYMKTFINKQLDYSNFLNQLLQ